MSNIRNVYGEISTNNSSTTPLLSGVSFTGTADDVTDFSMITVFVHSDESSATDGISMEFSTDGVNWDRAKKVTTVATPTGFGGVHTLACITQYFRVVYTNGGTDQTEFRLQTKYHTAQSKFLTSTYGQNITTEDDVELSRSVITGLDDSGIARNVNTTPSGNIKVGLFDSQTNSRQIVDLNGAAKTGVATILSGDCLFGQDLSPFLWKSVELNGGTTTGGSGEQLLETGAAADGQVILQSVKKSRFMISQFNINHFGIQLNPTDLQLANTVYEWGSVDFIDDAGAVNATPNGVFIRVTSGATPAWEVVTVKDGVETTVPQASWTGTNAALFNPLPSLSVYEMQYNAGTAFFFQGANFLHRIAGLTSTYASTYSFPVALRIRNVGTVTGSRTLASRAAGTYRLGIERGELISRAFTTADYNVAGGILIKTGSGYVGKASLSRDGNSQTGGKVKIFDGIDNTGILIGQIDISGTALASITMDGTFSDGLFLEIDPSNNTDNTVTINFE